MTQQLHFIYHLSHQGNPTVDEPHPVHFVLSRPEWNKKAEEGGIFSLFELAYQSSPAFGLRLELTPSVCPSFQLSNQQPSCHMGQSLKRNSYIYIYIYPIGFVSLENLGKYRLPNALQMFSHKD